MATKVYTFQVTYEGLDDKIWRKVAVSSNYRLDQLGYTVLAAFDTMAYHLFEFYYDGERFEIPNDDAFEEQIDMAEAHTIKPSHTQLPATYRWYPLCSYQFTALAPSTPGKEILTIPVVFTCLFRFEGSGFPANSIL